jgi:hypothetical protein
LEHEDVTNTNEAYLVDLLKEVVPRICVRLAPASPYQVEYIGLQEYHWSEEWLIFQGNDNENE